MKPLQNLRLSVALALLATPSFSQPPGQPSPPLIKPDAQRALRNGPISMNYENLDLRVMARIVSELTGRTIVMDESVNGKVTLLASSQMTADELWNVFEGILLKNGYELRRVGDIYQALPVVDARRLRANTSLAVVLREGDATQLLNAIKPLVSDPNQVQVYGPGKSLVISDTPQVLAQVVRLVKTIDRATPKVRIETIFLQHAEAEKLAPVLQQTITRSTQLPGVPNPVVAAFAPTNAIVIQAIPENFDEIRKAVAKLDIPQASPLTIEKPRYFVYKLQHGKAEDVAKMLGDLLAERKRAQEEEERRRGRQAATTTNTTLQLPSTPNPATPGTPPRMFDTPTIPTATNSTSGPQLAYVGAKVGADVEINAVLVYVSPSEYPSIRNLLSMLDRRRKQILVHAMVAEVTLSNLLESGSRLQLFNGAGPISSFNGGLSEEGLLSQLTSGQFLVGAAGGDARTINISGRDVTVPGFFTFLSANRTNRDFELISSPRLVATDHKQAEMKVGNVVPFATGARFSQIGQPVVTYDYKDVGVKLTFTPHISQSQNIRLELEQEVQEVTEYLEQNLGGFGYIVPLISNRKVKTDVNLRDGETLIIGGLISKRTTETIRKVPLLGDIPLIQNLFRELRKEERKTSLFVALTPYVVNSSEDIARIDEAYAQFLATEGLPNQAQWEPRNTQASRQPVSDPYQANAVDQNPMLVMEDLQVTAPTRSDRLRQARLTVRNRDRQVEAEMELRLKVTRPDKSVEELVGPTLRLAPGESREVALPPYPFPDIPGRYQFGAEGYVQGKRVTQTGRSQEIVAP